MRTMMSLSLAQRLVVPQVLVRTGLLGTCMTVAHIPKRTMSFSTTGKEPEEGEKQEDSWEDSFGSLDDVFSVKKPSTVSQKLLPRPQGSAPSSARTQFSRHFRSRNINGAWNELQKVLASGLTPTEKDITLLLSFFKNEGQFDKAIQSYEVLLMNNVHLNIVHYNVIVEVFSVTDNTARMNETIQTIKNKGLEPNSFTYASALKGLIQNKRMDIVETLITELAERKLADKFSLSLVIRAYINLKEPLKAKEKIELYHQLGLNVDPVIQGYESIVLAQLNDPIASKRVVASVPTSRLSAMSLIEPLNHLADRNDFENFQKETMDVMKNGFRPNLMSITKWMQKFEKNQNTVALDWILELTDTLGLHLDRVAYMILIRSCVPKGQLQRAQQYLQHMSYRGVPHTLQVFAALLATALSANNLDRAKAIVQEAEAALSTEIRSDPSLHNRLLSFYGDKGNYAAALALISHMRSLSVPVDVISYNNLLKAVRQKQKNSPTMMEILSEMAQKRIAPAEITVDIFLRFFIAELSCTPPSSVKKDLTTFMDYCATFNFHPSPNNDYLLNVLRSRLSKVT